MIIKIFTSVRVYTCTDSISMEPNFRHWVKYKDNKVHTHTRTLCAYAYEYVINRYIHTHTYILEIAQLLVTLQKYTTNIT